MEVETKGPKNLQDSSSAWGQGWSSCGGSTWMIEREKTTFSWPLCLAQETPWDRPVDPFSKEQFPVQGGQKGPSTAPSVVHALSLHPKGLCSTADSWWHWQDQPGARQSSGVTTGAESGFWWMLRASDGW